MTDTEPAAAPSIDDVVALQRDLGIATHVAYLGRERFVLAHTDEERASGEPLDQCRVHRALSALDDYDGEVGYFRAAAAGDRLELVPLTGGAAEASQS